jgi:hypothetical protein
MILSVSCHDVSSALIVLGLVFELGAIWAVLRKFVPRRSKSAPSQPIEVKLDPATEVNSAGKLTVGGLVESKEPPNVETLREEIRALQGQIEIAKRGIEGKLDRRTEELERRFAEEVHRATMEAIRGDEEIRDLIREQTREELAEQKAEGLFFASGVVLQLGAAALVLVC